MCLFIFFLSLSFSKKNGHRRCCYCHWVGVNNLLCRYEQGLEDYEEAVARVDKIKEDQQRQQQQAYGLSGLKTALTLIETVSNVWNKVSNEVEQKQSTIVNKSIDRPVANDFDGNDQNGK